MKLTVTYEQEDILQLIKKDLLAQGLKHDFSTAVFVGTAEVTITVAGSRSDEEPLPADPAPVAAPTPLATPASVVMPHTAPVEAAVPATPTEEPPADMSAILAMSQNNAKNNPGIFPEPQRKLLHGESYEWPGSPEPRGR